MTTSFWDIPNADLVVFMGSNAAENHPISFKWFLRAKQKGAKMIVVDPRYTRTASKADWWIPFRSGSDIAVLGGLINYAITNNKIHHDYVVKYTNAALLVDPKFGFDEGLFSGWDSEGKKYNTSSWAFQTGPDGLPLSDETLTNPHTVFQHIKRIYGAYTPEKVSEISGISVEDFKKFAEMVVSTAQAGKSAVFAYAMGWTQHTKGVQNIRASTLLQMLLGNIGVAGGGIAALRGHANVQGATDLAVLYHDLPGYLGQPTEAHKDLKDFLAKTTPGNSYWVNKPKFMVSLLKAWWGEKATAANDFGYHYIPKMAGGTTYSHYDIFQAILDGKVKGLLNFGQNPAVGSANAKKVQDALSKLDWLVVADLFQNETSEFWKLDGMDPKAIQTEVILLPAAGPLEKEGSFTNSHRLIQWKHKAIEPLGDSHSDGWYINELGKRLKKLYASSTAAKDEPINYLVWDYDTADPNDFDHHKVVKEINGYDITTGKPVAGFAALKDDGTTACGCWIYSGIMPDEQTNKADARKRGAPNRQDGWTEAKTDGKADYLHLGWAFAWPANRRVLYNRASADPAGNNWSKVPLVWWDAAQAKWVGVDVPDMLPVAPDQVHALGVRGDSPFIMKPQGLGGIWGPLPDGPIPVHYEPKESPIENPLYKQQSIPTARTYNSKHDQFGTPDKFPYVVTTYRLTEHQTSGAMTRTLPYLAEAFARHFCEIPRELAQELNIKNGDWVEVESARGKVKVQAMVTSRMKPFTLVGGKKTYQIGLPIHWAPKSGFVQGDITNTLTPQAVDVNVQIQESKVFLGNVRKV